MLNAVLSNLCAVEAMIIDHAPAAAESTVLDRFGVISDLPAPVEGVCSQPPVQRICRVRFLRLGEGIF
jgi:hypothetical protein